MVASSAWRGDSFRRTLAASSAAGKLAARVGVEIQDDVASNPITPIPSCVAVAMRTRSCRGNEQALREDSARGEQHDGNVAPTAGLVLVVRGPLRRHDWPDTPLVLG